MWLTGAREEREKVWSLVTPSCLCKKKMEMEGVAAFRSSWLERKKGPWGYLVRLGVEESEGKRKRVGLKVRLKWQRRGHVREGKKWGVQLSRQGGGGCNPKCIKM